MRHSSDSWCGSALGSEQPAVSMAGQTGRGGRQGSRNGGKDQRAKGRRHAGRKGGKAGTQECANAPTRECTKARRRKGTSRQAHERKFDDQGGQAGAVLGVSRIDVESAAEIVFFRGCNG